MIGWLGKREIRWEEIQQIKIRRYEELNQIDVRANVEDPTLQATLDEFIYLGPFNWLVQEVACVDFCSTVLGCLRNDRLYQALEDIIYYGSILMTFERLCIICNRPSTFMEDGVLVSYADGYCVQIVTTQE